MVTVYDEKTIGDIRTAADIVTAVLLELVALTKPDVNLDMLDELAERMIRERGGEPYNKGYKPEWAATAYPATICAAVNEEVCHATPRGRVLKEGDIVTYDLGVRYQSGCGDAAITVAVGEISNRKEKTMRYCKRALYAGIKKVKAGVAIRDVSDAIGGSALIHGYNVIQGLGGHTIGKEMHEEPHVPNWPDPQQEDVLFEGQVICLEPMISPGKGRVGIAAIDGWTVFTLDSQPCAMYEHMILVTKDGYEILTKHFDEN